VEVASIGYPPINCVREGRRLRRALRAMRTAMSEYARRRRFGPRPDPAGGALPATAARMGEDTAARMRRRQIGETRTRIRRRSDGTAYDTGTQLRWRDLTHTPESEPAPDVQHDLDPADRHSLPLYPPPDPAWTAAQGRHAAPELPREVGGRRRRLDAGGRY
jgi:hypothetical protein